MERLICVEMGYARLNYIMSKMPLTNNIVTNVTKIIEYLEEITR